jgi:hypothetical protein
VAADEIHSAAACPHVPLGFEEALNSLLDKRLVWKLVSETVSLHHNNTDI